MLGLSLVAAPLVPFNQTVSPPVQRTVQRSFERTVQRTVQRSFERQHDCYNFPQYLIFRISHFALLQLLVAVHSSFFSTRPCSSSGEAMRCKYLRTTRLSKPR
jgi:hypothetical protein